MAHPASDSSALACASASSFAAFSSAASASARRGLASALPMPADSLVEGATGSTTEGGPFSMYDSKSPLSFATSFTSDISLAFRPAALAKFSTATKRSF